MLDHSRDPMMTSDARELVAATRQALRDDPGAVWPADVMELDGLANNFSVRKIAEIDGRDGVFLFANMSLPAMVAVH
jgi:hypothetical protein